ncbi:MAG: hypothetical protein ACEY26_00915 [Candidatus Hodgkinia cicadicola]
MLSNIINEREMRSLIFKVLNVYAEWLACLCKICTMSYRLFERLFGLLTGGEDLTAEVVAKPTEAASELNPSDAGDRACEAQPPAVDQSVPADAKVETSKDRTSASENAETEPVSTEAKGVTESKPAEGGEVPSSVTEAQVAPKPETTSEPSVEGTKLETTSDASAPNEVKCDAPAPNEVSNAGEAAKPTSEPSVEGNRVGQTPSAEGEVNESKPLEEIDEFASSAEFMNNSSAEAELSAELALEEARLPADEQAKATSRADEFNEEPKGAPKVRLKANRKSQSKRVGSKRKLASAADC